MKFYPSASVIEAVQWTGDNLQEVRQLVTAEWLTPFLIGGRCALDNPAGGIISAAVGEWIIKEPGDVYRISSPEAFDEAFDEAYERIEPAHEWGLA